MSRISSALAQNNEEEYEKAVDAFFAAGLKNGFSQDPESATEDYVPDFDPSEVLRMIGKKR